MPTTASGDPLPTSPPSTTEEAAPLDARRFRKVLVGLAAVRVALGVAAIPLAPFLYRHHVVLLVLLRPTMEVLLLAGFLVKRGDVGLASVLVAAVPLNLLGVWHFYFLGKSFCDEIREAKLPGLTGRLLPAARINRLREALAEQGAKLVFFGRLAAFPSTLIAAAAGTSDMRTRRFLRADALGAAVSISGVLAIGFVLGRAYDTAGPWLTAIAVVITLGLIVLYGKALLRKAGGANDEERQLIERLKRIRRTRGLRAAVDELKESVDQSP